MEAPHPDSEEIAEAAPAVLGDVLYGRPRALVPETEWVALVRAIAAGDPAGLRALFERSHRLVYTLAVRVTGSPETAEEVALDVFHDLWRRAGTYDPANGTVLGWVMNQARSRAVDRLRRDHRQKRTDPGLEDPSDARDVAEPPEIVQLRQDGVLLRRALAALNPDERQAIEAAFMSGLTHAEAAERLNEPLGTIKTRIRSGLQKLRRAMEAEGGKP